MHCETILQNELKNNYKQKIQAAAAEDENSRLGAYLQVNPDLIKPIFQRKPEFNRVCISRYRCGSHNLMIEKGRFQPFVERNERVCKCNNGIQSLRHVVLMCPLLRNIRDKYNVTDLQNGVMNEQFLMEMEIILEIK